MFSGDLYGYQEAENSCVPDRKWAKKGPARRVSSRERTAGPADLLLI